MKELEKKIHEIANKESFTFKDCEIIRCAMESESNSFSFDAKKEVADMFEQLPDKKSRYFLTEMARAWILYWASTEYRWVDDRNRISVEKCKRLKETSGFSSILYGGTTDARCASIMKEIGGQTHRTLVQSLSAMMFLILDTVYPQIGTEMEMEYGEKWYRSPMI